MLQETFRNQATKQILTAPLATSTAFPRNSAESEMIGNVDFGISNSSSAQTGYEDFTNISINVSQGSAYGHYNSILGKRKFKEGYAVWIDFNSDGDFDDAGEQVWTTNK
jgi:hypothetical protein